MKSFWEKVCEMEEEEVITIRPKEGNPNFEELFVRGNGNGNGNGNNHDEYGFARDAAEIGLVVPGLGIDDYQDDAELPDVGAPPGGGGGGSGGISADALAHLNSRVKLLTDPVLMFVAEAAVSCGSSLQQMMLNPSLPLVNTEATSFASLLSSSQFPRELLLILMARMLLDTPSISLSPVPLSQPQPQQPQTPQQQQQQQPVKKADPDASVSPADPSATPTKPSNAPIGDTIREYIETLAPVGVNPFSRQQQQQQQQPDPEQALYNALLSMQERSDVLSWTWSQMPEESGMALLKPEIISVIQSCFESVRSLSESHRRIKLWHLITGPMVRHKFARLVGSLLNTVPSEIQYPGFTSVRRNGGITGSRVSSGITLQAQHSRIYTKLLAWFKNVGYREAEEWVQVNQRLQSSRETIQLALDELNRARTDMVLAAQAIWKRLSNETQETAANLWFFERQYTGDRPGPLIDQLRSDLATRPVRGTLAAAAGSDVHFLVPLAGPIEPPGNSFVRTASPRFRGAGFSSGGGGGGGNNNNNPGPALTQRDQRIVLPDNTAQDKLIPILRGALGALDRFGRRVQTADDAEAVFTLTSRIHTMLAALAGLKRVFDQSFADRRLAASFDETRRVELVYTPPLPSRDRPPVRNFLY